MQYQNIQQFQQQNITNQLFEYCRGGREDLVKNLVEQYPWLLWTAVEDGTGRKVCNYVGFEFLNTIQKIVENYCHNNGQDANLQNYLQLSFTSNAIW